jgi:hypothetical protein
MESTQQRTGTGNAEQWRSPYCQIKHVASMARTRVALNAYGNCANCGSMTDGFHAWPGGALLCGNCCPAENPTLGQISAA